VLLAGFLAASCAPLAPQGAGSAEVSPTPSLTMEPTKTPTRTPEPTATPEPEFNVCIPEQFRYCRVSVEDLFNGNYLKWLYTLSKPFDPAKVRDVPFQRGGWEIRYAVDTAPNFKVKGTEPFRRDVTAGYVEFTDLGGVVHEYAVLPIEFFDKKHPDQNQWVITVNDFGSPNRTVEEMQQNIGWWKNNMNYSPIQTDNISIPDRRPDPLVAITFQKHPEMDERFARFVNYSGTWANWKGKNMFDTDGQDMTALSEPGVVLLTHTVISSTSHWYE